MKLKFWTPKDVNTAAIPFVTLMLILCQDATAARRFGTLSLDDLGGYCGLSAENDYFRGYCEGVLAAAYSEIPQLCTGDTTYEEMDEYVISVITATYEELSGEELSAEELAAEDTVEKLTAWVDQTTNEYIASIISEKWPCDD